MTAGDGEGLPGRMEAETLFPKQAPTLRPPGSCAPWDSALRSTFPAEMPSLAPQPVCREWTWGGPWAPGRAELWASGYTSPRHQPGPLPQVLIEIQGVLLPPWLKGSSAGPLWSVKSSCWKPRAGRPGNSAPHPEAGSQPGTTAEVRGDREPFRVRARLLPR